ncbi:MAG TPA: hypothetical protein EYO33_24190 [Phycisphaerales bacterium]|nr:hypothetical protein [Phycisphaerales bacterium]
MAILFKFAAVGEANSNLYSLEKLQGSMSAAAPATAAVHIENMGEEFDITNVFQTFGVLFTDNGSSVTPRLSLDSRSSQILPVFLGKKQALAANALLRIEAANTNGVTLGMRAEGYIWSARSVLADGGPSRPPGARYGNS